MGECKMQQKGKTQIQTKIQTLTKNTQMQRHKYEKWKYTNSIIKINWNEFLCKMQQKWTNTKRQQASTKIECKIKL